MQAARDHGLGRKFKLGRNILSGTIFSRAFPKWMNPTEFRPNSVESQNRGQNQIFHAKNSAQAGVSHIYVPLVSYRFTEFNESTNHLRNTLLFHENLNLTEKLTIVEIQTNPSLGIHIAGVQRLTQIRLVEDDDWKNLEKILVL